MTAIPPGANAAVDHATRAFPTPIEVLGTNPAANTASVVIVGWRIAEPVDVPLDPIVAATGIAAADLPGLWLEADVNCYAASAADLVIRRITIAPDLPDESDDDLPTREALIETIAAADDERDRLEAETARLRSAATRVATALDDLIECATDPGVEALGARWELRHALGRTCLPEELITPAAAPPLYPTRNLFHVEVQQHHGAWWTNVPAAADLASAEAEMAAEVRNGRPARVVHDRRTFTLVASRAPESAPDAEPT